MIKATGGFDPCFLFQGTLATLKNGTPISQSLFDAERTSDSDTFSSLRTPSCSPDQPLTLYISYEQPSPKIKRARLDVAPYRYSLREEADDSLIACSRGLATEIIFDKYLNMAVWGKEIALSFPSFEEMQHFATCLRKVTIKSASLSKHPLAVFCTSSRPVTPPSIATLKCDTCETPKVSLTGTCSLTGTQGALLPRRLEDAISDADSPPPESGIF